jgi:hypothetical protein
MAGGCQATTFLTMLLTCARARAPRIHGIHEKHEAHGRGMNPPTGRAGRSGKVGATGRFCRPRYGRSATRPPEHLAHCLDELGLVGKFPRLKLGIQPLAAHCQLEASPFRRDHHVAADLALVARQELGRQTDGLGLVVSKSAVFQDDFHRAPPPSGSRFGIDRRSTVEGRRARSGRGLDRTPRRGGLPWSVQVSSYRVGNESIDLRPSLD